MKRWKVASERVLDAKGEKLANGVVKKSTFRDPIFR